MKNTLILVIFLLFSTGVFGEDVTVNVMEGDSVSLHTGTKIQTNDVMTWSFGQKDIAKVNSGSSRISVSVNLDERFRDRLQMNNQTGDLKISNIRVTDSGEYKLQIISTETLTKTFRLMLADDEVKSVSVMVGDSVTLNTDLTEIQKYDVMRWRFENQNINSLIAETNRTAHIISKYDGLDGRFKHRLDVDYWTGSLTIKNMGINLSGVYEVDLISSSKHTIHKTFNVTVSGETRTVFMMEGDSLTLHTDLTEIQSYDFILWMFGDIVLAEIYKTGNNLTKYIDESFRDRLNLDEKSGSLNVRNIKVRDSGLYELKISSSKHGVHKRNIVTVTGETSRVFVTGESLTLHTDLTEINTDDLIQWTFKDSQTVQIYQSKHQFYISDESYRDRLSLDEKSGSLTIRNIRNTDSGLYELKINGSRHSVHKRFTVTVTGLSSSAVAGIVVAVLLLFIIALAAGVIYHRRKISMLKRHELKVISANMKDDVTLRSEKQRPDEIQWMFGDQEILIAKFKRETGEFAEYDGPDGRFRDRLKLDNQTGSLTITNITTEHAGYYKLQIIKSDKVSYRIFCVTLSGNPEELLLNSADAS